MKELPIVEILNQQQFPDPDNLAHLSGGGKMGAHMRSIDWSQTPVGCAASWPLSLKLIVKTLLECRLPMHVSWGKELTQFYNDAYRPILGNKHPEAMGISTKDTWYEIWPTVGPMFAEVAEGKSFGFENMMFIMERFGYREECYFNFSYSPIPSEDGSVAGVLATCTEITEIVKREQRLKLEREKLYSTLMQAPAGVAIMRGPQLVFELCNQNYYEMVGKNESIIGKTLREAIPELDEITLQANFNVFNTGITFIGNEHAANLTRDGKTEVGYFNFIMDPARDSDGTIYGVIVFAYEVTGQVLSRMNAEKLSSELQIAVNAREEFTSIASHELRTPLTILALKLQMAREMLPLKKDDAQEMLAKTIHSATAQVERLADLIENLLDVTRIQSNKLEYQFGTVRVGQLIQEVLDSFGEQLKSVKCSVDLQVCADLIAYWDYSRIEQILVNLISNAIKYAPGKPVLIQVTTNENNVTLTIQDGGPGIPQGQELKIFERFERASNPKYVKGLGLGLFIVRQIVKGHQGMIRVESEQGQGAKFIVVLPLRPEE